MGYYYLCECCGHTWSIDSILDYCPKCSNNNQDKIQVFTPKPKEYVGFKFGGGSFAW